MHSYLERSLESLKQHCWVICIPHLAMPTNWCGLDKLNWEKVQSVICKVFQNTIISIFVYKLPIGSDSSHMIESKGKSQCHFQHLCQERLPMLMCEKLLEDSKTVMQPDDNFQFNPSVMTAEMGLVSSTHCEVGALVRKIRYSLSVAANINISHFDTVITCPFSPSDVWPWNSTHQRSRFCNPSVESNDLMQTDMSITVSTEISLAFSTRHE